MNTNHNKILCIETSTEICSVVLAGGGLVTDVLEDTSGMKHSKKLTQFIDQILKRNQLKAADLSAIVVSEGPGSYTGLRIGVSAAKGICYAANIKLIAISSLEAMANHVLNRAEDLGITLQSTDYFLPMIDARRMEVYRSIYNLKGELIEPTAAVVVDGQTFANELEKRRVLFFGNGSDKLKSLIHHPNAFFIDGIYTSARHMVSLGFQKLEKQDFVDVAYFEPFYLKDFMVTTSKKSFLQ